MKGVMRVVLAIAEKYNPRSVRPITGAGTATTNTASTRANHLSTSSSSSSSMQSLQENFRRSHSPERARSMDQQHSPRASSPGLSNYMQQGNSLSQVSTIIQFSTN